MSATRTRSANSPTAGSPPPAPLDASGSSTSSSTNRRAVLVLFLLITAFMVWSASRLRIDAGFTKLLPAKHPYMQTYLEHVQEFGGANRVLVALVAKDGDMFTPEFFTALKEATDEVFFLPGVDRGRVSSLFTPNVRYTEVVEDGIAAGNVIPDDFSTSPEGLEAVRRTSSRPASSAGWSPTTSAARSSAPSCSRSILRPARSSTFSGFRGSSRRRSASASTPPSFPTRR